MFKEQYEFIKSAREALLNYCSTISRGHLSEKMPGFGHGSINTTLIHVANVYLFWISQVALQQQVNFFKDELNFSEIREAFDKVNEQAELFIKTYSANIMESISGKRASGAAFTATAFKIFTHVITHEFHHKGQILSMSRQLSYTPIDTDIIRFEN